MGQRGATSFFAPSSLSVSERGVHYDNASVRDPRTASVNVSEPPTGPIRPGSAPPGSAPSPRRRPPGSKGKGGLRRPTRRQEREGGVVGVGESNESKEGGGDNRCWGEERAGRARNQVGLGESGEGRGEAPPAALGDKYTCWGEERARNQVHPRYDQLQPFRRVVLRIERSAAYPEGVPRRRFALLKESGMVLERQQRPWRQQRGQQRGQQRPWTAGPVRSTRKYSRHSLIQIK